MVRLPEAKSRNDTTNASLQSAQSVPDLRQPKTTNTDQSPITSDNKVQSKSTTNISHQQRVTPQPTKVNQNNAKNHEKEIKRSEKQRLAELKKREAEQKKLEKKQKAEAAKEAKLKAAHEAKLKKEREKAEKERLKKEKNNKTSGQASSAPPPPPMPTSQAPNKTRAPGVPEVKVTNPLARTANPSARTANPLAQTMQPAYSTNTLDSSISRTSGPPPYTEEIEAVINKRDNSGNTSFGKTIDEGNSWDLISQHRQQMNRPVNVNTTQRTKNFEYSVGNLPKFANEENSEA